MRLFACLVLGVLFACGGGDEDPSDSTVDSGEPAEETHVDDWPCEEEGYPCTWEEVDAQATERGFSLADRALERFEPGTSNEVVSWLAAQPGVVEAGEEDPSLIWFRVEGGRPIMVQGPLPPGPLEARLQGRSGRTSLRDPEVRLAGVGSALTTAWNIASSWTVEMRSKPLSMPGVTGRDRNEDTRVNQRDQRKALILESTYWEDCYEGYAPRDRAEEVRQRAEIEARCEGGDYVSVGEKIKGILEESPAYKGNVQILRNQEVDFDAIGSWADYDVIHVNAHGSRNSVCIGTEIAWPGRGKLRGAAAERRGVDPTVFRAGDRGPKKSVWCVNHRFFRTLYPDGLDRAFIFVNACSTLGHPDRPTPPMADQLLGEQSMYVGWGGVTNRWYEVPPELYSELVRGWSGKEAVRSLPMYLDQIGEEPGDPVYAQKPDLSDCENPEISLEDLAAMLDTPPEELVQQGGVEGWCRRENEEIREQHPESQRQAGMVLGTRGSDMRIREVVKLFHPPSPLLGAGRDEEHWVLLEDGDDLGRLVGGALGDGEDDLLRVTVAIEALKLDEPPSTFVHLELDGEPIGEPWSFETARQVDYRPHGPDWAYRLDLDGPRVVEVGKDLEAGEEYELEAVVDLPEGGESRYSVKLRSELCDARTDGDFEVTVGGYGARRIPAESKHNSAKVLPYPDGGWYLHLRNRFEEGFQLTVDLDDVPEVGDRIHWSLNVDITEVPSLDPERIRFGGNIDEWGDRLGWLVGDVTVAITGVELESDVDASTGPAAVGVVCGEIDAALGGWRGGKTWPPPRINSTVQGEFWAELRRRDPED